MELADYLAPLGYATVTLTRAKTGHLALASSFINGQAVTLYLDTGAGRTVLDLACAQRLGLSLTEGEAGGGVGSGGMKTHRGTAGRLQLGPITRESVPVHAIDMTHVNRALAAREVPAMDGVVGADVLDAHEAVIDYRHLRLFLKRSARTTPLAA